MIQKGPLTTEPHPPEFWLKMSDKELETYARNEARNASTSSAWEGIEISEEKLVEGYIKHYKELRDELKEKNLGKHPKQRRPAKYPEME